MKVCENLACQVVQTSNLFIWQCPLIWQTVLLSNRRPTSCISGKNWWKYSQLVRINQIALWQTNAVQILHVKAHLLNLFCSTNKKNFPDGLRASKKAGTDFNQNVIRHFAAPMSFWSFRSQLVWLFSRFDDSFPKWWYACFSQFHGKNIQDNKVIKKFRKLLTLAANSRKLHSEVLFAYVLLGNIVI